MTLMMAKRTCQTMQRTGATLVVRTESWVTWWDRMEQDIVCAFVAAACSLIDEDICEDISECVHAKCAAFFGRETGASTWRACGEGRAQLPTKIRVGDQETTGARRAGKEEFDVQDLWTGGPLGW